MSDRIKLTEDDFIEFDLGGETYWKLDCTKEKKQQILEDVKKASFRDYLIEQYWYKEIRDKGTNWYDELKKKTEKWDILENAKTHEALVKYVELVIENKYLLTIIEKVNDKLGNELQVKVLEIEALKKELSDALYFLKIRQQKLSKIEELTKESYYGDGLDLNNKLKAIIEGNKE